MEEVDWQLLSKFICTGGKADKKNQILGECVLEHALSRQFYEKTRPAHLLFVAGLFF